MNSTSVYAVYPTNSIRNPILKVATRIQSFTNVPAL